MDNKYIAWSTVEPEPSKNSKDYPCSFLFQTWNTASIDSNKYYLLSVSQNPASANVATDKAIASLLLTEEC